MTKLVTAQTINWNGKTYKAAPSQSSWSSCAGCAFHSAGWCSRPDALKAYTCSAAARSDQQNTVWIEED